MPTTIKDAIKKFEEVKGVVASEVEKVELLGMCPPIEKMDGSLAVLKTCRHLALSTNNIDKIGSLAGMDNIRTLSLGRNIIKAIANLDTAPTLEELWISYNQIDKLAGIEKAPNLRILYMSNNKIASWAEIDRLKELVHLQELLLVGNPLYTEFTDDTRPTYRIEVLKRCPNLIKLDGIPVDPEERSTAKAAIGL